MKPEENMGLSTRVKVAITVAVVVDLVGMVAVDAWAVNYALTHPHISFRVRVSYSGSWVATHMGYRGHTGCSSLATNCTQGEFSGTGTATKTITLQGDPVTLCVTATKTDESNASLSLFSDGMPLGSTTEPHGSVSSCVTSTS